MLCYGSLFVGGFYIVASGGYVTLGFWGGCIPACKDTKRDMFVYSYNTCSPNRTQDLGAGQCQHSQTRECMWRAVQGVD